MPEAYYCEIWTKYRSRFVYRFSTPHTSTHPNCTSYRSMTYVPTHYEILDLPESIRNATIIPAQTLRTAYRRALLQNHPDKSSIKLATKTTDNVYSIDQISHAYTTLSNSNSRAAYNKELRLQGQSKD